MRRTLMTSISVLGLLGVLAIAGNATVRAAEEDRSNDAKTGACNANLNLPFGAGATQFTICLSSEGNVVNFVTYGADNFIGWEGYQLCTPAGSYYDLGNYGQSGWGAAAVVQPNGPHTLPITITRNTLNGQWSLKQTYAKDNTEGDFTITMALKKLATPIGAPVYLGRWNDFDMDGDFGNDFIDRAVDSVWARGVPTRGATLTASSFATSHFMGVGFYPFGAGGSCTASGGGPAGPGDMAGHAVYSLGGFNAGQTKTVKFVYARK